MTGLNDRQQRVLALVLGLLLIGFMVKTWRTAGAANADPAPAGSRQP